MRSKLTAIHDSARPTAELDGSAGADRRGSDADSRNRADSQFPRTELRPERKPLIAELGRTTARALYDFVDGSDTTIRDLARATGVSETRAAKWLTAEVYLPLAFLGVRQVALEDRLELSAVALLASAQTPGDQLRIARQAEKFWEARVDALVKEGR